MISKDGVRLPTKKPTEGQARAKFNFQAQSAIELSLNKGELVVLTRRVDDNWFEGRIANRKGIFPVSYVEVSNAEPSLMPFYCLPCFSCSVVGRAHHQRYIWLYGPRII